MNFDRAFELVCGGKGIVIEPDGCILPCVPVNYHHIISGSFDPLHSAHRALYYKSRKCAYEMSIVRYQKEDLTKEELQKRLKQFEWYAPVIVTNAWRYEDKAAAINNPRPTFHIGYDTAARLLDTETEEWLEEIALTFVVYQRFSGDRIKTIWDLPWVPKCFTEGFLPEGLEKISSSQIRGDV